MLLHLTFFNHLELVILKGPCLAWSFYLASQKILASVTISFYVDPFQYKNFKLGKGDKSWVKLTIHFPSYVYQFSPIGQPSLHLLSTFCSPVYFSKIYRSNCFAVFISGLMIINNKQIIEFLQSSFNMFSTSYYQFGAIVTRNHHTRDPRCTVHKTDVKNILFIKKTFPLNMILIIVALAQWKSFCLVI